jgi:hypothetical protein
VTTTTPKPDATSSLRYFLPVDVTTSVPCEPHVNGSLTARTAAHPGADHVEPPLSPDHLLKLVSG